MSFGFPSPAQRPFELGKVDIAARSRVHYDTLFSNIFRKTDRMFAILLGLQLLVSFLIVFCAGSSDLRTPREVLNIRLVLFGGTPIALLAIALAILKPTRTYTRHVIAIAQMCASALLIQITGGRAETHFHVFGSLAFLAFYRDWRVLITATIAISVNHFFRGIYFPLIVFGAVDVSAWRWLEYVGWILFEDFFLVYSCLRTQRLLKEVAHNRAELEAANVMTELAVSERTKELAETNIRLRANIEERQRAEISLTKAKEAADTANRTKSEFLANMSHEIRTPMNGVLGMSTLLLETPLNDQQRDFTETIRQSCDALLVVINDILDFSKIEASTIELAEINFDLRTCIEDALDLFALKSAQKKLELVYLTDDSVPTEVAGDPTRFRQILVNVIGNAVKFTERGSVFIEVHSRPLGRAEQRSSAPSERWHEYTLHVRDTGIGISAERKDRLFKPFSQADASMSRRYGGTGLGLAISKRIAEVMGGGISLSSTVGVGSCFTIIVKLRAPEDFLEVPLFAPLAGKRVFIGEGRALSQKVLAANLGRWGLDPKCFNSLASLNAELTSPEPIDAVVISVPEITAEQVRAVCDRAKMKKIPVILLEPAGRVSSELGALHDSIAAVLFTPVKSVALRTTLLQAIEGGTRLGQTSARRPAFSKLNLELPLRILLTEDNLVNQRVATRFLAAMGYDCEVANNGQEAVAAISRNSFDVVLMDLQMPEMDGYEATRVIRGKLQLPRRPQIIALTAHASVNDRDLCLGAGMDDYLTKPLSVSLLEQKLRDAALRLGMVPRLLTAAETYSI